MNQRGRVLCVQRTGWGESMVYFVSAKLMWEQGAWPTLIISPLLALMGNLLTKGRTPIASGAGGCLNRTFYGERVIYSPIKAPPCKKRV